MRDRLLIFAGLLAFVGLLTLPIWNGATPMPTIPQAKGTHCIRDTEWMLKNHMKLLMHVRDEVVYRGIRDNEETLPGCMSCHVSRLADGRYPSVTSPKFFCNSCHGSVGVKIDCFSCHTNRPGPVEEVRSGNVRQMIAGRQTEGSAR